jgi:hypothetical protein
MKTVSESVYGEPQESELPLFAGQPTQPPAKVESRQQVELKRVKGKTADWIQQFFDRHQMGQEFHAEDLHAFVKAKANIAPASADRIMRDMKQSGQINYEVVNRSQSLYRKLTVGV